MTDYKLQTSIHNAVYRHSW